MSRTEGVLVLIEGFDEDYFAVGRASVVDVFGVGFGCMKYFPGKKQFLLKLLFRGTFGVLALP